MEICQVRAALIPADRGTNKQTNKQRDMKDIARLSSSVFSHVLISGNLSVLSSKTVIS